MSMMIGMSESTNASGPENQTAVTYSHSQAWSAFEPTVTCRARRSPVERDQLADEDMVRSPNRRHTLEARPVFDPSLSFFFFNLELHLHPHLHLRLYFHLHL
jgi:hypothetical protein